MQYLFVLSMRIDTAWNAITKLIIPLLSKIIDYNDLIVDANLLNYLKKFSFPICSQTKFKIENKTKNLINYKDSTPEYWTSLSNSANSHRQSNQLWSIIFNSKENKQLYDCISGSVNVHFQNR